MTAAGRLWIASYPKSGNTWVRLILSGLAGHGDRDAFAAIARAAPNCAAAIWVERVIDLPIDDLVHDERQWLRHEPSQWRRWSSPDPCG